MTKTRSWPALHRLVAEARKKRAECRREEVVLVMVECGNEFDC